MQTVKKILFSLVPIFACYFSLQAEIHELESLHNLAQHIQKKTLIIFDIDDTLIVPAQMLGSDVWFQHYLKSLIQEGMATSEAVEETLRIWLGVRHLTEMELVEPGIDLVIQDLQKEGMQIMGLTLQGASLAMRTHFHLLDHTIDLAITAPRKEDCYFYLNQRGILFREGILFTAGRDKGKSLFRFFDLIDLEFDHITVVDDKRSNLESVENVCHQRGIEFVGIRYGYGDARKNAFDPKVAEKQLAPLQKLLSNQEALAG